MHGEFGLWVIACMVSLSCGWACMVSLSCGCYMHGEFE